MRSGSKWAVCYLASTTSRVPASHTRRKSLDRVLAPPAPPQGQSLHQREQNRAIARRTAVVLQGLKEWKGQQGGGERGWGAVVRRRLVNPCEYNVLNDGQAGWGAGWHVVALRTCHCMCVCVCARARACVCVYVCMYVCVCSATAASPSGLYAVGGASFQTSPLLMKRRRRREGEEEEEKEGLFKVRSPPLSALRSDAVNSEEDSERDRATLV